jgi:hypothetical protein
VQTSFGGQPPDEDLWGWSCVSVEVVVEPKGGAQGDDDEAETARRQGSWFEKANFTSSISNTHPLIPLSGNVFQSSKPPDARTSAFWNVFGQCRAHATPVIQDVVHLLWANQDAEGPRHFKTSQATMVTAALHSRCCNIRKRVHMKNCMLHPAMT